MTTSANQGENTVTTIYVNEMNATVEVSPGDTVIVNAMNATVRVLPRELPTEKAISAFERARPLSCERRQHQRRDDDRRPSALLLELVERIQRIEREVDRIDASIPRSR